MDAMRRMTANYLYILVGLALTWLVAIGCGVEPAAGTRITTDVVSSGTPEAATQAAAEPTSSLLPDGGAREVTEPPRREPTGATSTTTPIATAAGSEETRFPGGLVSNLP